MLDCQGKKNIQEHMICNNTNRKIIYLLERNQTYFLLTKPHRCPDYVRPDRGTKRKNTDANIHKGRRRERKQKREENKIDSINGRIEKHEKEGEKKTWSTAYMVGRRSRRMKGKKDIYDSIHAGAEK